MRMSCTGLQIEPAAGNLSQLAPQPGHHRIDAVALAQRLQRHVGRSGVGLRRGAASARSGEADDVLDRRVALNDRHHLLELLAHEVEGNALIGDEAGDHPAGVLLGKEAFRDDDDQPDVEGDRSEQGQEHQEAVVERD